MAVLDATNRARVAAQWMRDNLAALGALSKADLRTAVNETDQWIEDNQAAYNLALSQPARGALTTAQKTLLFCYVAMRRSGLGQGLLRAQEDG